MAELSHRALRELIESFKLPEGSVNEYFTEMISAGALLAGGPWEKYYADNGPCPDRLVYQIVGHDAGQLAGAAAILDKRECLGIDINMGCSAPAITRTGAGVAWLRDIDKTRAMVGQVRQAVKNHRLSVKLRTGWTSIKETPDFDFLAHFCQMLEEQGVEMITLHGRSAKEKFKRSARWDYVARLHELLRIPVVGNGDIQNAAQLAERAESGICDGVMVGRAAVKQPWIFAEARNLTQNYNIEEIGLRFLGLLAKYQPPEFHLSRARRFFSFFCDNLKWGNYVKNLLNREQDLSGIARAWTTYFDEHGEEESGETR
jgi:tRNA-dihydrouridine synthase